MTPQRRLQIEDLVEAALERDTRERSLFLAASLRVEQGLRAEVEALLASYEKAESFLEVPAYELLSEALTACDQPGRSSGSDDDVAERLGPYRILRRIGVGGMGAVYLAVRDDAQYRQEVAIKVAQVGLSDEGLRRFRSERQILATLNHPSIARLLDGGSTPLESLSGI